MVLRLTFLSLIIALGACSDDSNLTPGESLEKSCRGEVIPNCRGYEYAIVRTASVTPDEVEVGDPIATVEVRFTIDACPDAPSPHTVAITAVDESRTRDGGATGSMAILDTFRDNSARDEDPAVGVFQGTIDNFFLDGLVAPRSDLTLVLEPRIDVCRGASVELPYRTGPMFVMPTP
jgi:hypothetical protein